MASKRRNMFYQNMKQTTEIGKGGCKCLPAALDDLLGESSLVIMGECLLAGLAAGAMSTIRSQNTVQQHIAVVGGYGTEGKGGDAAAPTAIEGDRRRERSELDGMTGSTEPMALGR
ncbi:hypothetical protein AAG570_009799 [Ranatra chinensis]|uniref:Uncharacterized protein n=1 Tax=Ranatra chinensis TaxID=642074 RepID=A0ABD0YQ98_9HEMI